MKHAYLIMAHNNFDVVAAFLRILDSEDNDFYIHINKKIKSYPESLLKDSVHNSKLFFVPRVSVGYYNYTMVEAVKSLFNSSIKNKYDYYHLVSCSDMPIKSKTEIDKFFTENNGKLFVGFAPRQIRENSEYFHFFSTYRRLKSSLGSKIFKRLAKLEFGVQRLLKVNRLKNCPYEVKKGCDWYSITHDAAVYLMENEPIFKKYFYRSFCPTEYFAHTVLYNSDFRDCFYDLDDEFHGLMRFVDWDRGRPYVFRSCDFDELISSDYMFARKFMENIDFDIVRQLENYLTTGLKGE